MDTLSIKKGYRTTIALQHQFKKKSLLAGFISDQQYNNGEFCQFERLLMRVEPEVLCKSLIEEALTPQLFYHPQTGDIIVANPALCKFLGYSHHEIVRKNLIDLIHPEDRRFEQELFFDSRKNNKNNETSSVKRYWTKSGELLWVILSAKRITDEQGEVVFVMATLQDVSSFKQTEEKFLGLIGHLEHRLSESSHEIEQLRSQVKKTDSFRQKFVETASHEFRTPLTVIQTNLEIVQRYKDKLNEAAINQRFTSIYEGIQHITVLLDNALHIESLTRQELLTDISDDCLSNENEEQVLVQVPELGVAVVNPAHKNKRDDLLALQQGSQEEDIKIMIHDLQNPLSSVMLMATSIERNWHKMSLLEIKGALQAVQRNTMRMKNMITQFLEVSSLENMVMTDAQQRVDLVEFIQTVVDEHKEQAAAKHLTLHFKSDIETAFITSSKDSLTRIIENILSNALKYSYQNTAVNVCIAPVSISSARKRFERKTANRKTEHLEQYVRIAITNQGQGIRDEDMGRLFTKFGRLSAHPMAGESSTGLGLWIVKRLVEFIQGHIWCESTYGEEATFFVELPLART